MIHFVIIIDFLTATLNKKYIRVKQKNPLEVVVPKADFLKSVHLLCIITSL